MAPGQISDVGLCRYNRYGDAAGVQRANNRETRYHDNANGRCSSFVDCERFDTGLTGRRKSKLYVCTVVNVLIVRDNVYYTSKVKILISTIFEKNLRIN